MKIKYVYIMLCILGLVVPYSEFAPYIMVNGFSMNEFLLMAFSNSINAFISWDLIIVAISCVLFMVYEGRKSRLKHLWLPIVSVFLISASFGFPLFLFMREQELEKSII